MTAYVGTRRKVLQRVEEVVGGGKKGRRGGGVGRRDDGRVATRRGRVSFRWTSGHDSVSVAVVGHPRAFAHVSILHRRDGCVELRSHSFRSEGEMEPHIVHDSYVFVERG